MSGQHRVGRRRLFAGALAGGVAGAGANATSAAAASTDGGTRLLPARKLRVGDLVLGPEGNLVRLATVDRLSSGRIRLRYTNPTTGAATPFDAASDAAGFAPGLKLVVVRRRVKASSVRLTSPRGGGQVIDGGSP